MTYKFLRDHFGSNIAVMLMADDGIMSKQTLLLDVDCPEWDTYQDWLAEGNEPLPAEDTEITWDTIRAKRDQLIADSDWTMIPGATVDQAAWAAYRQVLRDLPQTYAATGPESIVWPVKPSTAGPNTTELE